MSNASNVNAFSPVMASGGLWIAPAGTAIPTTIDEPLDEAFTKLGYVSEDGLVDSYSNDSTKIPCWGGTKVTAIASDTEHTLSFSLLECTKREVAEYIYGKSNVTGEDNNLTIKVNDDRFHEHVLVVDMYAKNSGTSQRNAYPRGIISEIGDTVYIHSDVTALEVTVDFLADDDGNTEYIYIEQAT